jgi:hypothetical protein
VKWVDSAHVILNFNAFPGVTFNLESADALDSTVWTAVRPNVLGGDAPIQLGPIDVSNVQKFYRLRPAP